jgi:hypothetical protein
MSDLTFQQQLAYLYSDLREIESQIELLQRDREGIREQISLLVAQLDNRVELPGVAVFTIRAPSIQQRWNSRALADLIQSLRETGQGDIADEIARCKQPSESPGGLAIVPARPKV